MSWDLPSSVPPAPYADAGRVLVLGAGVAGIRAAIDLAEVGCQVTLVDSSPAIGGILAKLDHQFPNNHCGMCRMLPEVGTLQSARFCLRKGLFHDRIDILPDTSVQAVRGEPGSFEVDLLREPHRIDNERCAGCTRPCLDVCPVSIPDAFNHGLTRRKAIYHPVPQSLPGTLRIDRVACTRCGDCVDACPQDAIDLNARHEPLTLRADALILTLGTSACPPNAEPVASYLRVSPNVMTALSFERFLGIAGPRRRALRRPSDGKPVQRVAWLQCVGSRDRKHGQDACSTVCCMFALKEAMLVRDLSGGSVGTTIFYMDIRGQGRDFHQNRMNAERNGVRLVRSRVHDIGPGADGGVRIRYYDPSCCKLTWTHFDMVVLSTGQRASAKVAELGQQLGWGALQAGYAPVAGLDKMRSPTPGVFVAGSIMGPTDIAESIVSATAAASEATKLLLSLGRRVGAKRIAPPPKQVQGDETRVLALVCRCHHDPVGSMPDAEALRSTPGVDMHGVDSPCLPKGAEETRHLLANTNHDRLVFAACLAHTYRRKLVSLAEPAGFDPALVRVVDARHSMRQVRMAAVALRTVVAPPAPALSPDTVPPRALIVGGGLAGMRAALSLAHRNVQVHLVERDGQLGGRFASHRGIGSEAGNAAAYVASLRKQVLDNAGIIVHLHAQVEASKSWPGRSDTTIRSEAGSRVEISHGATILATGGHEAVTTSYGYGTSKRIITQDELERLLAEGLDPKAMGTVVMLQCVDSREPGFHDYCSRVCCRRALRNAQWLRDHNPEASILVLYRDMMTCGPRERDFTKARREGILFVTFEPSGKPRVDVVDGKPSVTVRDPVLDRPLRVDADWLVLSTAIEPDASAVSLARVFGASTEESGFLLEADAKWRPVDSMRDGVYVVGVARIPQPAREVLAEAEAAAQRAFDRLSRRVETTGHGIALVHDARCARCGLCVEACSYGARRLDEDEARIVVDPLGCRGCGVCTVACPNSATRLSAGGERQVMEALDVALEDVSDFPWPKEEVSS